ncbi:MAG: FtsX-like permease family protein [Planctomycetes bacterium]|nr:FtsX-like permease family protein [Planctomycetota bacterium]
MLVIALKMLFYDRAKYLGLVLGVAFSTLLINQQVGIFLGLIARAGAIVSDVPEANIWVMDRGVKNLDTIFPLRDTELGRVRGVPGVEWAVPLFKANATVRTAKGDLESSILIGVDDSSLIGVPPKVVMGDIEDLRRPDAVAVSQDGFTKVWRYEPLALNKTVELNDRRAVVVAIVKDSPKFTSAITFFTRYSQALQYTNNGRNQMSFVVARSVPDRTPDDVAAAIEERTGLQALSAEAFRDKAIQYVIDNTGIPVSFGTVVGLGVIVGVCVAGLMFNLFVLENLKQFAVLKAIGTKNSRLIGMVFLQALVVGFVGYSIGLFGASCFFEFAGKNNPNFTGFYLPSRVAIASGAVAAIIILIAALIALRRLLFVDPAIVFRG